MPYVPKADRRALDIVVEAASFSCAGSIKNNLDVILRYREEFTRAADTLEELLRHRTKPTQLQWPGVLLGNAVYEAGEKHGYNGAYLGELNYAVTRFIQRVPSIMVADGRWKDEFRYWYYAAVVEALMLSYEHTKGWLLGIAGVFMDVKDEFKWKVNRSYEMVQIAKNGDCYDTPYYSRAIPVLDQGGKHAGYIDLHLERSSESLAKDILDGCVLISKKPAKRKHRPLRRRGRM